MTALPWLRAMERTYAVIWLAVRSLGLMMLSTPNSRIISI